MISVKSGTQTWSTAPQKPDFKSEKTNSVSSTDAEKYFQNEDIGNTLNKVADPGFVDESKKMRTVGNNQLGKDAFMTLLLTQMKNQDPTNPLKSHEMAAQLAQFTSLEKLQGINDGVDNLRKDMAPGQNFQALSFIGKTVMVDNSKVSRADADSQHTIRFNLPADAPSLKAQVKDAAGMVVRTLDLKNLKSGKNEIQWNGMTEDGTPAPVGEYTVTMEAAGSNGRKLFVETKTEGVISGVNFTPHGPQLMIGKQILSISDVKTVSDSSVPDADPLKPVPLQGPKKVEVKPETKANAGKAAKLAKGDLNDAAMAQGLINQINKAGAKAGMSGT
jgi:flagellar basal-body rod modification protein FlgD